MSSQVKKAKMNDTESTPPPSTSTEKDDSTSKVVATSMAASVSVALHPLVIMNISDHYTRIKAQEGIIPTVFGALLGKQAGRNMELFNSFELRYSVEHGIDMDYLKNKEEQFRQVFTELDLLGWYTVGTSTANEQDIDIQKQLLSTNENLLLLKLDPVSKSSNLPVTIYESMIDIVDEQSRMMFIEVAYTLITEEAERIGVDHVARLSSNGASQTSQASEYMLTQKSAVKMLHSRICIIKQYVEAVKNGSIEVNHDILRDCMSLCQRLPLLDTETFDENFYDQYNDVNLMTFLAAITKGCNMANEFEMIKHARRSNLSLSRLQSPITSRWLHENYEMKDGVSLPRNCLYTHYLDFCSRTGIEPVNAASFGKIIRTTFPELKTRRLGTRGQSKYHYYGIGVRSTSLYYESTYIALNRQCSTQTLIGANQTKEQEEPKKEVTKTSHKATSYPKSSIPLSVQQHDTSGTILPDFPKSDSIDTTDENTKDKVKTFLIMYRAHCQRILDTVIRANFSEIQNFLDHFWQGMPSHIAVIFSNDDVTDLIATCDNILYKAVGNVLIPGVLQPLPVSLTHAIQQFAKQLCHWLEQALSRLPEKLQNKKMTAARQFSQLLCRQTSLSHLAHAARTVLHHSESAAQMAHDLKDVSFKAILNQLTWINNDNVPTTSFMKFYKEFRKLLDEQASVEQFANWISSLVNRCIVRPTEKEFGTFQSLAQSFLLNWSFITSKLIQELTLKSAQSFGSFHLLQMLLDDFIFYLIESHADISEEIIADTGSGNETFHETTLSPASSSGRGSLSPKDDDDVFHFPSLIQNNSSSIEYNFLTKNVQENLYSYGNAHPCNIYSENNLPDGYDRPPYIENTMKSKTLRHKLYPIHYDSNRENGFTEDVDIVQRLQEKTKSLMEINTPDNFPTTNPFSNWGENNPFTGRYAPYPSTIIQRDAYSFI